MKVVVREARGHSCAPVLLRGSPLQGNTSGPAASVEGRARRPRRFPSILAISGVFHSALSIIRI